jgi:uncharacterized protein
MCVDWRGLIVAPSLSVMSEPTPPGSAPQEPTPPTYQAPPSAPTPPGYSTPPPSAPPGYSAPPSAPYAAPGGGQPPLGGSITPSGYNSPEDKNWALIAHFGGALGVLLSGFGGWIAPLIAWQVRGQQSPTVKAHALAALNFQALWAVISVIAICLGTCLSWLLVPLVLFAVPLFPLIIGILAGVKANNGELYRYPATINLIK